MCLRAVFGYAVLLITYRHMVLSLALVKCKKTATMKTNKICLFALWGYGRRCFRSKNTEFY